jgi:septum site-determining protein MinD
MPDHHVFAVASGKGGVGKTTTAVNLGAAAAAAGRSAVVVDADLGMANVTDFLAVEPAGATLHDALAGDVDAPAAAIPAPGGVDVVPGAPAVESFSDADPANLPDAVAALRERYDVVILDAGAGLSHDTVVPLGVADAVVVVTTPQTAAVRDARKTIELTERFGGEVAGVVVVDVGGVGDRTPADVTDVLDADLLAAVPESPAVPESAEAGVPLREYAPDDAATRAYRDAAARLLGDPVPDDEGGDADDAEVSDGGGVAAPTVESDDREPADDDQAVGDHAAGGDADSDDADSDDEATADPTDADDHESGGEESGDDEAEQEETEDGESDTSDEVVIEDAESGTDGESSAEESAAAESAGKTVLGETGAADGSDAVPDDAMPTNLPGTEDDGDGADSDDGAGWLSRLTGGRLG